MCSAVGLGTHHTDGAAKQQRSIAVKIDKVLFAFLIAIIDFSRFHIIHCGMLHRQPRLGGCGSSSSSSSATRCHAAALPVFQQTQAACRHRFTSTSSKAALPYGSATSSSSSRAADCRQLHTQQWKCAALPEQQLHQEQQEADLDSVSGPQKQQQQQRPAPLQVTRHNFHYALPVLAEALAGCQFYAFDCEMSGLYPPGLDDYPYDDVDDR